MKKQLTPKIAETLAIQKFQQIESEEDREFRIAHAKTVGETAIILAEGKNLDNNILLIAGWIHDIGSIISQDNHAVHSLDMLIKEDYEISAKLKDCIQPWNWKKSSNRRRQNNSTSRQSFYF